MSAHAGPENGIKPVVGQASAKYCFRLDAEGSTGRVASYKGPTYSRELDLRLRYHSPSSSEGYVAIHSLWVLFNCLCR